MTNKEPQLPLFQLLQELQNVYDEPAGDIMWRAAVARCMYLVKEHTRAAAEPQSQDLVAPSGKFYPHPDCVKAEPQPASELVEKVYESIRREYNREGEIDMFGRMTKASLSVILRELGPVREALELAKAKNWRDNKSARKFNEALAMLDKMGVK